MTWNQIATQPWMLWRRQVAAILRLELKKSLFSKRAWWIYILTLGPVASPGLHSLVGHNSGHAVGNDERHSPGLFPRAWESSSAASRGSKHACRAEVLERTLHYSSCRRCAPMLAGS